MSRKRTREEEMSGKLLEAGEGQNGSDTSFASTTSHVNDPVSDRYFKLYNVCFGGDKGMQMICGKVSKLPTYPSEIAGQRKPYCEKKP